jgi:LGFP repeat
MNYFFVLEKIRITKTRARHNDTVHVNFALKIADRELAPVNRHMGDLNDGTYRVDLAFGARSEDPGTPVLFSYQVLNKGHGSTSDQLIEKGLNEGAHALATALAGTGNIWAAGLTELFRWVGGFLNPDCDGPLAADKISVSAAVLRDWTAETGFHREEKYFPGVDSAWGCGSNSQYYVTWYVIGTPKAVYGAIGQKWVDLNGNKGPLGAPLTDESDAAGGGRFNDFQYGHIYWRPDVGAHAVYGAIAEKWVQFGRENGLGYPITDELNTQTPGGRYNHFEKNASIFWSPQTGAHAVYGYIRGKYAKLGWDRGPLGFPVSDEEQDGGGRISKFQHGFIYWSPQTGALVNRRQ